MDTLRTKDVPSPTALLRVAIKSHRRKAIGMNGVSREISGPLPNGKYRVVERYDLKHPSCPIFMLKPIDEAALALYERNPPVWVRIEHELSADDLPVGKEAPNW